MRHSAGNSTYCSNRHTSHPHFNTRKGCSIDRRVEAFTSIVNTDFRRERNWLLLRIQEMISLWPNEAHSC